MPNFPKAGRRDGSGLEDTFLAALLEGTELPADAAPGLRPVADVLAALRAGPTGGELAGADAALAQFRRQAGVSGPARRPRRRRTSVLTVLLSAKASVAAASVALTVGAAALAAFAGALPTPMQKLAHQIIGAPAARPGHSGGPSAAPHPSSPSAHALCTAYRQALAHGTAAQRSVAVRNVARIAGGRGKVAAFCAQVLHSPAPQPPSPRATGKPTPHGKGKHKGHPGGKPSSHPSHPHHPAGKPTSPPTHHPHPGKPTSQP